MLSRFSVALLIFALALVACAPAAPAPTPTPTPALPTPTPAPAEAAVTPSVTASNQAIVDGAVTIAEVVSSGPGWIVIHADQNGGPGPVIGYTAVTDGVNKDVVVKLDVSKATATLYAMLHTDAGTVGTYEFPGPDGPVAVEGKVITPAFQVTGGLPSAKAEAATVMEAEEEAEGKAEGTAEGQTVTVIIEGYRFGEGELTVAPGTTVIWRNESSAPHTVTADNGLFDSGNLARGDQFQFTFTEEGEYPYYCRYHGGPGGTGMAGKVIVKR